MLFTACTPKNKTIWQIGENNNSASEFALSNNEYKDYIAHDFGWEDKYFLVGTSNENTDWPYIIPGISDTWGGTWGTSGWRSSTLNILFGIDVLDCNSEDLPLFKVSVNGKSWKYRLPVINEGSKIDVLPKDSSEYLIEIPIPNQLIQKGGNEISFSTIEASTNAS